MNTILDTSVILENLDELFNYKNVVIPYCVLKKLDKKKYNDKLGYKARKATRFIIKNNFCIKKLENSENNTDDIILAIV